MVEKTPPKASGKEAKQLVVCLFETHEASPLHDPPIGQCNT
jgi:hypothetical protein